MAEKDFTAIREHKHVNNMIEIVYKVPRPNSEPTDWLGFIRFKSHCAGPGSGGIVEITNRKATLQPGYLDLGCTSKANNGSQAGAHGEGLKVALLVLMRGAQNHKVRCRSGGYNWYFNFTKENRLAVALHRMSDTAIERAEAQARKQVGTTLLPICPSSEEDVQFIIGEQHRGRSECGLPTKRKAVSQDEFETWTKAALFLQDPKADEQIRTTSGDLLLGARFQKRLYLRGLLLEEDKMHRYASLTNKPLKYGYNFSSGVTDRERRSVAGVDEESAAIWRIWSKALEAEPKHVGKFSDLLNATQPEFADVADASSGSGKKKIAKLLKSFLVDKNRWYYSPEERKSVCATNDLKLICADIDMKQSV